MEYRQISYFDFLKICFHPGWKNCGPFLARNIHDGEERSTIKAVLGGVEGVGGSREKGERAARQFFLAKALADGASGLIMGAPLPPSDSTSRMRK